jgi:AcrR family transcriptional regulator
MLREELADLVAEKVTKKIDAAVAKQEQKLRDKRERLQREQLRLDRTEQHVHALERLATHLDALEVWTRAEGAGRRPRFSRDEIATAAVRLADTEGFESLSMRRLAAELGAGTMTLYHYIRTKDELLTLVNDAVMGELLIPAEEGLPEDWRDAITEIADRTRICLQAHPWIFDITDDPPIGPNAVRHFDQTLEAVSGLGLPFVERLDIVGLIDEYVFGYCLHERNHLHPDQTDDGIYSDGMVVYMEDLLATGEYPQLQQVADEIGLAECMQIADANGRDPERFHRNLQALLDGIEAGLERRRATPRRSTTAAKDPRRRGRSKA